MTDETGSEHRELAADAEREADELKHQGDKLGSEIEDIKADWEQKQEDASVPGAVPDPGEGGDPALIDQSDDDEPAED